MFGPDGIPVRARQPEDLRSLIRRLQAERSAAKVCRAIEHGSSAAHLDVRLSDLPAGADEFRAFGT